MSIRANITEEILNINEVNFWEMPGNVTHFNPAENTRVIILQDEVEKLMFQEHSEGLIDTSLQYCRKTLKLFQI